MRFFRVVAVYKLIEHKKNEEQQNIETDSDKIARREGGVAWDE